MTNQTLTRYEPAPMTPVVTDEQLELVRRTVANGATDAELQLYLYDCARHGVHPLDKLLHFTKRSGKYTPITSIDLLRSRATDTGELAGIDDPQYAGDTATPDFCARVTVYRMVQGQRCPFAATARWSEYKPADGQDHMWRKMPHLMLGKCAEALALRKAFPRQLAGLYAREEMDQASGASYQPPTHVDTTTGEIYDPPASEKQRNYIATLQDKLAWNSEQLAEYASEQNADLAALTKTEASILIETLKALADKAATEDGIVRWAERVVTPAPEPIQTNRASLVRDLKVIIMKARDAGHAIGQVTMKDLTDEQITARIAEIKALMDAPVEDKNLPIGDPATKD